MSNGVKYDYINPNLQDQIPGRTLVHNTTRVIRPENPQKCINCATSEEEANRGVRFPACDVGNQGGAACTNCRNASIHCKMASGREMGKPAYSEDDTDVMSQSEDAEDVAESSIGDDYQAGGHTESSSRSPIEIYHYNLTDIGDRFATRLERHHQGPATAQQAEDSLDAVIDR